MLKVLHITGHLGGGVGTVVLNYLAAKSADETQSHSLCSLDHLNVSAAEALTLNGIPHFDRGHSQLERLKSQIQEADVVLLHWWNHPLISDLLVRNALPECRLAIWSHISGSPAPNNFTRKIFLYPDEFVFTTPLSFFDPEFMDLPEGAQAKVSAIWSTAGVERLQAFSPQPHEGFNIGYIGNLDFTKIHPEFLTICRQLDHPGIRFTVVGPRNERLDQQFREAALTDRVRFTGHISEKEKWAELCRFDVFGYPLAPHHYGTCDQTLQEAMAVGIVPVVLNNPMESYIVKHGEVGLVARSIPDYVACVHTLMNDTGLRARLSMQARAYAFSQYTLEGMSEKWDAVFQRLRSQDKRARLWPGTGGILPTEPHQVFLESLGRHAGLFSEHLSPRRVSSAAIEDQIRGLGGRHNWQSDNKSTVHQYAQFFPQDLELQIWSRLMKGIREGGR